MKRGSRSRASSNNHFIFCVRSWGGGGAPARAEVTVYEWMHAQVGRIRINMHDSTAVGSPALYANDLIQV